MPLSSYISFHRNKSGLNDNSISSSRSYADPSPSPSPSSPSSPSPVKIHFSKTFNTVQTTPKASNVTAGAGPPLTTQQPQQALLLGLNNSDIYDSQNLSSQKSNEKSSSFFHKSFPKILQTAPPPPPPSPPKRMHSSPPPLVTRRPPLTPPTPLTTDLSIHVTELSRATQSSLATEPSRFVADSNEILASGATRAQTLSVVSFVIVAMILLFFGLGGMVSSTGIIGGSGGSLLLVDLKLYGSSDYDDDGGGGGSYYLKSQLSFGLWTYTPVDSTIYADSIYSSESTSFYSSPNQTLGPTLSVARVLHTLSLLLTLSVTVTLWYGLLAYKLSPDVWSFTIFSAFLASTMGILAVVVIQDSYPCEVYTCSLGDGAFSTLLASLVTAGAGFFMIYSDLIGGGKDLASESKSRELKELDTYSTYDSDDDDDTSRSSFGDDYSESETDEETIRSSVSSKNVTYVPPSAAALASSVPALASIPAPSLASKEADRRSAMTTNAAAAKGASSTSISGRRNSSSSINSNNNKVYAAGGKKKGTFTLFNKMTEIV